MEKGFLGGYLVWAVLLLIALAGVFAAARVREKIHESEKDYKEAAEA